MFISLFFTIISFNVFSDCVVCPTKLQFRTAFGAHLAALASVHCRVTMKSASPRLSPPATKYFLSYFHSRVFLTEQFFSSSWNSMLTIPITFFPACILFQNLPHLYSWLLWTSFSSLFQGKLVYTFLPENSVWASHPLWGCFAVFVKILCPLLPWFRWKFPSHAPSLIISSCLNAILFCFQSVSVFPPFLPFSYEAPALPFTVQSCFSLS